MTRGIKQEAASLQKLISRSDIRKLISEWEVGWNMTAADPLYHHVSVTSWQYNAGVAEEFIAYKDEQSDSDKELTATELSIGMSGHRHKSVEGGCRFYCSIC